MSTSPPSLRQSVRAFFKTPLRTQQSDDENTLLDRPDTRRKSDLPRFTTAPGSFSSSSVSIRSGTPSIADSRQPPWSSPALHADDTGSQSTWPLGQEQPQQQPHWRPPSASASSLSSANGSPGHHHHHQTQQFEPSQSSLPSALPSFDDNNHPSSSSSADRPLHRPRTPSEKSDMPSLELLKINHGPFLSSTRNVLDLVSVLAFWLHLFGSDIAVSFLAALSTVRILRFLTITEGTTVTPISYSPKC